MRGALWADPDLDEAAQLDAAGRRLARRGARARRGRARAGRVASAIPRSTGAIVRQRLEAIRQAPTRRSANDIAETDDRRPGDARDALPGCRACASRLKRRCATRSGADERRRSQPAAAPRAGADDGVERPPSVRRRAHRRDPGRHAPSAIRSGPRAPSSAGSRRRAAPATARRALDYLVRRMLSAAALGAGTTLGGRARRIDRDPLDRSGQSAPRGSARRCSAIRPPASSIARACRRARVSSASARSRRRSGRTVRQRVEFTDRGSDSRAIDWQREGDDRASTRARAGPIGAGIRSPSILPPRAKPALDVVVTLSTRVAAAASVGNAWALFGEPRFEWRRRPARCGARSPTFARRRPHRRRCAVRSSCCAAPGIASQDAEAYPRWIVAATRATEAALDPLAAGGRRAAASAAHQRHHAGLQHRSALAARLRSSRSAARSIRTGSSACATTPRRRRRPSQTLREYEGDPRIRIRYLAGQRRHLGGVERGARDGARRIRRAARSRRRADAGRAGRSRQRRQRAPRRRQSSTRTRTSSTSQGARCDAYFKPDWSPDHFLTCMYTCHLMVLRRQRRGRGRRVPDGLRGRAGLRPGAAHLIARRPHRPDPSHPAHPLSLAQAPAIDGQRGCRRSRGRSTRAAGRSRTTCGATRATPRCCRAERPDCTASAGAMRGTPLVSIVIPTAGTPARRTATRSICSRRPSAASSSNTRYDHYEFIVVARRRRAAARIYRHRRIARSRGRAIRCLSSSGSGCSTSRRASTPAPRRPTGDHLLLFNDDLEVIYAGLADGDARVLAGAGDRRGRPEAALSGRPAAARRHRARRGRRRRARVPPASGRVARLRRQRDDRRATTPPSPARA